MRTLILLAAMALLGACGARAVAPRDASGGALPAVSRDAAPPPAVSGGSPAAAYAAAAAREVQRYTGRRGAATVCVSVTEGGRKIEPDSAWLAELAFVGRRVVGMRKCVHRTWPMTRDSTGSYVPTLDVPPPPGGDPDILAFEMVHTPEGATVEVSLSRGPSSQHYLCHVTRGEPSPSARCTRTRTSIA